MVHDYSLRMNRRVNLSTTLFCFCPSNSHRVTPIPSTFLHLERAMLYLKSISPSLPPLSRLHDKHLAVWLFAPECEFDSCLKSLLFPLLYSLKLNCYPHIRENLICELSSHFSILWLVNIVGAVWISALNSRGKRTLSLKAESLSYTRAWSGFIQLKSESEVAQSCVTLCGPMDCSPPGFSVRGIFQARVQEWVAIW